MIFMSLKGVSEVGIVVKKYSDTKIHKIMIICMYACDHIYICLYVTCCRLHYDILFPILQVCVHVYVCLFTYGHVYVCM